MKSYTSPCNELAELPRYLMLYFRRLALFCENHHQSPVLLRK